MRQCGRDACEVIELGDGCWLDLHRRAFPRHDELFDLLLATTAWEQEIITLYGRRVRQPRLTAWFGVGMDSATRYRTTKPAHPWPPGLATMLSDLRDHTGVPLNSALANLYRDGKDAVAWHADDEPVLGPEPVIASVSLGGLRRLSCAGVTGPADTNSSSRAVTSWSWAALRSGYGCTRSLARPGRSSQGST